MSAESDVARAWLNLWLATPALVAAVPGGLHSDEVSQGQALPADARRPLPYAILTVAQDTSPRFGHRFWLDYRRVVVEVYGRGKVAMGDIVSLITNTFNHPVKLSFAGINANRKHVHTRHGAEDDEEPTGEKRHGEHLRQARVGFVIMTATTTG